MIIIYNLGSKLNCDGFHMWGRSIFVCKCVSVSECKLCDIIYVVVQRAKRKTAVAILVPQFSYFNFHMNFSCKLSVYIYIYIYICFLCMKIENKFYSILGDADPFRNT